MTLHGRAEPIEIEASQWLAKRLGSNLAASDQEAFTAWLEASTAHKIAYLKVEAAWDRAAGFKGLTKPGSVPLSVAAILAAEERPEGRGGLAFGGGWKSPWWFGIAACLTLVCGGISWWSTSTVTTLTTAAGEVRHVALEDGTEAILNTDTHLQFHQSRHERTITFERGEALFSVAKDPRPFAIEVEGYRVHDLGTRFTVHAEAGALQVSVLEGRVSVESSKHSIAVDVPAGIRVDRQGNTFSKTRMTEEEQARQTSWTAGFLEFRDAPFADVIKQFNRYHANELVIDDPALESIRIGGRYKYDDLDGFLAALQRTVPVTATRRDSHIYLRHQ